MPEDRRAISVVTVLSIGFGSQPRVTRHRCVIRSLGSGVSCSVLDVLCGRKRPLKQTYVEAPLVDTVDSTEPWQLPPVPSASLPPLVAQDDRNERLLLDFVSPAFVVDFVGIGDCWGAPPGSCACSRHRAARGVHQGRRCSWP